MQENGEEVNISIPDELKLLSGIRETIIHMVDYIQTGMEGRAHELLIELVDRIQYLIKLLVSNKNIDAGIEELTKILQNIFNSQNNDDYVLLSDILEYELLEWINNCKQIYLRIQTVYLSDDISKKNVNILKEVYSDIYSELKGGRRELLNFEVIQIDENRYTIKIKQNKEFYLNSRVDPIKEAQRFVKRNYKEDIRTFIVYGFGLGYHIRELAKSLKNDQFLYVIDLSVDIFETALKIQDLSDILRNKKINLLISQNISKVSGKLAEILNDDSVSLIIHNPSLRLIGGEYNDFKQSLEIFKMRAGSIEKFQSILQYNVERNIKFISNNVGELFGKFENIPVVIISAGPSLDKNINLLKDLKQKAILLSVGRALRALVNSGIIPDFFIITDPQEIVREQIRGLENLKIPALFMISAAHSVVTAYKGPKYKICHELQYLEKDESQYFVDTGGSVATAALDIAIKMGGNPIVFVGQDLAFSGGRHHASNTEIENGDNSDVIEAPNPIKIKGWDGEEINTTLPLLSFKKWIENRITQENNKIFINATEGGAFINGCVHMGLQKFIADYIHANLGHV